jgi:hypothetical protein
MTRHGKLHDNGMAWHGLARHGNDMAWKWKWNGMEMACMACLGKA